MGSQPVSSAPMSPAGGWNTGGSSCPYIKVFLDQLLPLLSQLDFGLHQFPLLCGRSERVAQARLRPTFVAVGRVRVDREQRREIVYGMRRPPLRPQMRQAITSAFKLRLQHAGVHNPPHILQPAHLRLELLHLGQHKRRAVRGHERAALTERHREDQPELLESCSQFLELGGQHALPRVDLRHKIRQCLVVKTRRVGPLPLHRRESARELSAVNSEPVRERVEGGRERSKSVRHLLLCGDILLLYNFERSLGEIVGVKVKVRVSRFSQRQPNGRRELRGERGSHLHHLASCSDCLSTGGCLALQLGLKSREVLESVLHVEVGRAGVGAHTQELLQLRQVLRLVHDALGKLFTAPTFFNQMLLLLLHYAMPRLVQRAQVQTEHDTTRALGSHLRHNRVGCRVYLQRPRRTPLAHLKGHPGSNGPAVAS
mmetsp:Transcript_11048/g.25130  ORF Transcript_11048/g.25130 Transcript_11048/m.25130 type:complete len:427 (-) Transcript_11048:413-1693(-)